VPPGSPGASASPPAPPASTSAWRALGSLPRLAQALARGELSYSKVDAEVLANADAAGQSVLEDGPRVPAGTSQRLACDASRVVMKHDADGWITEVGARTRRIPPALRRALHHRDRHHVRHWAQGGPTTLSNLALDLGHVIDVRHPRARRDFPHGL
jgi:hypothetical protein